jgi:predicted transcriptional regulator
MADKPIAEKKPILVLRERMGGVSDSLKDYVKNFNKTRKEISAVLKTGPKTVPEIAAEMRLQTSIVLWHIMGMKRYGQILEGKQRGDYFEYSLKEGA